MTKTAKGINKTISILMVILTLMSVFSVFAVPVSAATKSSGIKTRTMIVVTKANWWIPGAESITIKQDKGVCAKTTYNLFTWDRSQKESRQFGTWDIYIRALDGSHTESKTLEDGSINIKLKPNKTYEITVSWDYRANQFVTLKFGNFTKYPSWRVSKTHKVSRLY